MQDRVPPQNIEAEQAVLGAMLIEKEAIPKVMEHPADTDFYREAAPRHFYRYAGAL